jgi:hypothetical protein
LLEIEGKKDPKDTPTVKQIISIPNIEKIAGTIHTALRSKNDRYIFLIDNLNFYKYDGVTNAITVFEGKHLFYTY